MHVKLNHASNVQIVEAAVTDSTGVVSFALAADSSMGRLSPTGKLEVQSVSLDDLISRSEIPLPDYMKIDVEGAEMLVLVGAKTMLADHHPTLFLSTHGHELHRQCHEFLAMLGYEVQSMESGHAKQTDPDGVLAYRQM